MFTGLMAVSEGDYFEAKVFQASGGDLDVLANSRTNFSIRVLG